MPLTKNDLITTLQNTINKLNKIEQNPIIIGNVSNLESERIFSFLEFNVNEIDDVEFLEVCIDSGFED